MATFRRRKQDLGQAFKNDRQLQQFLLTGVTPTGRVLGTGSYGSVEEVSYKYLVCAGKKLHETLIDVENQGVTEVVHNFLQECQLMSSLHHPNITQFLGLCFLPDTQLPLLVMECLEASLDDLLEHMPNLPLSLKHSILEDVARGLFYLHDRHPPVIHRDLTSKNVLLTSSLVAKITDMGNSRIVNLKPGEMARTLTKYPGTLVYMPPEVQDDTHRYGAAMDVFSFGHLALFTLTQKFPGDLLPSTYVSPEENQEVKGRSEVERRGTYINLLEGMISAIYPTLVELVKQCLQNDPQKRPSTENLLSTLHDMKVEVDGQYGGGAVKLDLAKVKQAKQIRDKDRKIEELIQQQAIQDGEFKDIKDSTKQLEEFIGELQAEIQASGDRNVQLQNEVAAKDDIIAGLRRKVETLEARLAAMTPVPQSPTVTRKLVPVPKKRTKVWEVNPQDEIRLIKKLRQGQFKEVWEGTWNKSRVAIKKMKEGQSISISTEEFLKETVMMKRLSHSKLVKLHGINTQEKPIYFVMELMANGNLLDFLKRNKDSLELQQLIEICGEIAEGMAYMESKNCIHRDLAARNILVSGNMTCKVANFHLAVMADGDLYEEESSFKCPVKWTAPEAMLYKRYSVKSDIWSFGIVLYEVVTFGRFPYPGMSNGETIEKLQVGYRMPHPPGCPKKLYDFMLNCWRDEPERRFTFEALQWQLEDFFVAAEYAYVK